MPAAVGVNALGAVVGFSVHAADPANNTFTTSTFHKTTTNRVDRADEPAPACDFPGSDPALVDQTTTVLDPVVTLTDTIGPATILIGDLNTGGTAFDVLAGTTNTDVLSTYETVVTQYFQATAAGEVCSVLAAARFTG
jgi:hypothetical protein